jgi:CubicO group peptidase (beta-lactamase class C family)
MNLVYPEVNWLYAQPEDVGVDSKILSAIGQRYFTTSSHVDAFLVVRHGQVIWEQSAPDYAINQRHYLRSITKSVLSTLFGIALQEGLFTDPEQLIIDFFPEISIGAVNGFSAVTLHHLLTMRSGIIWRTGSWGAEPMMDRLWHSANWQNFIFKLPVRRNLIGRYQYNSANSHLLSIILFRITGRSAREYANQKLFLPLGFASNVGTEDWQRDPQGNNTGGWGLSLNVYELARIGLLYLRNGVWQDKQILPEKWVEKATHLPDGQNSGYGYQWWLRKINHSPVFAGIGVGGQYLFCLPEQDLIVVILSHYQRRWPDFWEVLPELIAGADQADSN